MLAGIGRRIVFTLILLTTTCTITAKNTASDSHSQATLSATVNTVRPGHGFTLLFHLRMRKGWHAYWKNPGDSGLAPSFKWQLPPGFRVGKIQWLPPERIKLGPLTNFGYKNDAYYLIPISSRHKVYGQHILKVKADWLVCDQECVPQTSTLSIPINIGRYDQPSTSEKLIKLLRKKLPKTVTQPISYVMSDQHITLRIPDSLLTIKPNQAVFFFPDQTEIITASAEQPWHHNNHQYLINLQRDFKAPTGALSGVLSISALNQPAQATHWQITAKKTGLGSGVDDILQAILFAIMGGIILNAMPCVFPILALKTLTVSQARDREYRHHLLHGMTYAVGVIMSFAALAGVLIVLQTLGKQVGWGYQMQSPITIAILAYLFLLITLNLLDFFQFGESITGTGQELTTIPNYWGSFFTGVLAAIVATPCTAPFMGAALGYALLQPPTTSFVIICSLGIGMALPLLLISAIPKIGKLLPRPGQWMQTFKHWLAVPMLLSVVWLIWVLSQQTQTRLLLLVLAGLIATIIAIWLYKKINPERLSTQLSLSLSLIIICALPIGLLSIQPEQQPVTKETIIATNQFTPAKLQQLLAEKQPIFVNVTAAWCLTCKFNEGRLFKNTKFDNLLQQHRINYLVADWTNRNIDILNYLQSFNRNGVPLYVVYNRRGEARVLPQLPTEQELTDQLKWADTP